MVNTDVQEMFEAAVHFGHKIQKWNPKMKRYIYGAQNGVHLFDLEKTKENLDRALDFLKKNASEGKKILFVSTKAQAAHLILEAARETNMPYVIHKWMAGLLTNFVYNRHRIRYFKS